MVPVSRLHSQEYRCAGYFLDHATSRRLRLQRHIVMLSQWKLKEKAITQRTAGIPMADELNDETIPEASDRQHDDRGGETKQLLQDLLAKVDSLERQLTEANANAVNGGFTSPSVSESSSPSQPQAQPADEPMIDTVADTASFADDDGTSSKDDAPVSPSTPSTPATTPASTLKPRYSVPSSPAAGTQTPSMRPSAQSPTTHTNPAQSASGTPHIRISQPQQSTPQPQDAPQTPFPPNQSVPSDASLGTPPVAPETPNASATPDIPFTAAAAGISSPNESYHPQLQPLGNMDPAKMSRIATSHAAFLLVVLSALVASQILLAGAPALVRMLTLFLSGIAMECVGCVLTKRRADAAASVPWQTMSPDASPAPLGSPTPAPVPASASVAASVPSPASSSSGGIPSLLVASGAVISLLALSVGAMSHGLYGAPVLAGAYLAWFVAQAVVASSLSSRLLYVIAHVGAVASLAMEGTMIAETPSLNACMLFALTSFVVPAMTLFDRRRHPVVPYLASAFSLAAAGVAGVLSQGVSDWLGKVSFYRTVPIPIAKSGLAVLGVAGILSAVAAIVGTRDFPRRERLSSEVIRLVVSGVGAFLMHLVATSSLVGAFGEEAEMLSLLAPGIAMAICVAVTGDEVVLAPAAVSVVAAMRAMHLSGLAALVAAFVSTRTWTQESHRRVVASLALTASVALPFAVMEVPAWAAVSRDELSGVDEFRVFVSVSVVPALAIFACLMLFWMVSEWISGGGIERMLRGADSVPDGRYPADELDTVEPVSRVWVQAALRTLPLGIALLACACLSYLVRVFPVSLPSSAPFFLLLVLAAAHLLGGLGLGQGWSLPGTERESLPWSAFRGLTVDGDGEAVARAVRGCDLIAMLVASAAVVWDYLWEGNGATFFSGTLVVMSVVMCLHAVSRRSVSASVIAVVSSYFLFALAAAPWATSLPWLAASAMMVVVSAVFVILGHWQSNRDLLVVGSVSIAVFALKIALIDWRGVLPGDRQAGGAVVALCALAAVASCLAYGIGTDALREPGTTGNGAGAGIGDGNGGDGNGGSETALWDLVAGTEETDGKAGRTVPEGQSFAEWFVDDIDGGDGAVDARSGYDENGFPTSWR